MKRIVGLKPNFLFSIWFLLALFGMVVACKGQVRAEGHLAARQQAAYITYASQEKDFPGIERFDSWNGQRVMLDDSSIQKGSDSKSRKAKLWMTNPGPFLFFLKNVWVMPGDSVSVLHRFKVGKQKGEPDTLIFSGDSVGGYQAYYFFRPGFDEATDFPGILYHPEYVHNLPSFKERCRKYFDWKRNLLDRFLQTHPTRAMVKDLLFADLKYQHVLTLLGPYFFGLRNAPDFPAGYFDDSLDYWFRDTSLLPSKYFTAAIHNYHLWATDKGLKNDYTPARLRILIDDAKRYPPAIAELLIWKDVAMFSKNFKGKDKDAFAMMMHDLIANSRDGRLKYFIRQTPFLQSEQQFDLQKLKNIYVENARGAKISFYDVLAAQSSKTVLLDNWASWCTPCRKEIPAGRVLESSLDSKLFCTIYLSHDADPLSWKRACKQEGLPTTYSFRFINQKDIPAVKQMFGFTGIPHYVLFEPGTKVWLRDAPRPSNLRLKSIIEELIKISARPASNESLPLPPPPKN